MDHSDIYSIGNYAFSGCSSLVSISLNNSIFKVGRKIFDGCTSLTRVKAPLLKNYMPEDFITSSKLTEWIIPYGVESIPANAFKECSSLTRVDIPSSVNKIGNWAFQGCRSLTSVVIPSGVKEIGDAAFAYCHGLTRVDIPASVTNIGSHLFVSCERLTRVKMPFHKNIMHRELYQQSGCRIKEWTIVGDYESIPNEAFMNYKDLVSIVIPKSVKKIGDRAFKIIPKYAFSRSSLARVSILPTVTSIEEYAFSNCDNLTKISIPSSVKSINRYTFSSCAKLTDISISRRRKRNVNDRLIIPGNVEHLSIYAFDKTIMNNMVFEDNDTAIDITDIDVNLSKFYDYLPAISYLSRPIVGSGYKAVNVDTLVIRDFINPQGFDPFSYSSFEKIKVVIADMPIPVVFPEFNNSVYENAILIVPHGAKALYENDEDWKKFKTIIEKEDNRTPTGINEIKKDKENRKLVARFNLKGQKLKEPEPGINILRYDDGTVEKVLVK